MNNLNKYQGCLVGLAVGDALGTTLEFKPKGIVEAGVVPKVEDIVGGGPFNLKPGQWTDDTSMALCLAHSLIEKSGFNAKDQMDKYWRWIEDGYMSSTGKMFDIGNTTSEALENYRKTGNPFAGSKDSKSSGNGSIMRLAPIPMFFAKMDLIDTCAVAAMMSETTHGSDECVWACRYLSAMIQRFLNGDTKENVVDNISGIFKASGNLPDSLWPIVSGHYKTKTNKEIRASGYVIHTLEAALWAFYNSDNFRDGAILAVNLCEDADTTGAVYGQIAGSWYGLDGIPSQWVNTIYHSNLIVDTANMLHEKSSQLYAVYREKI